MLSAITSRIALADLTSINEADLLTIEIIVAAGRGKKEHSCLYRNEGVELQNTTVKG